MSDETQAPAAGRPRRRVTLREMRERIERVAYDRRFHHGVMTKLAAEKGPPFCADPEEIAVAEAFEAAARVFDWLLRDDMALARLKEAAERGAV